MHVVCIKQSRHLDKMNGFDLPFYYPMEPGLLHFVDILHVWRIILHVWRIILHVWHITLHLVNDIFLDGIFFF